MNSETTTELTHKIGRLLLEAANHSAESWDYVGYMFETTDGVNSSGTTYLFNGSEQIALNFPGERREIIDLFQAFRLATQVPGDDCWIKCNATLRQSDKSIEIKFEFDNQERWSISPANFNDAFKILVGDNFPDAV